MSVRGASGETPLDRPSGGKRKRSVIKVKCNTSAGKHLKLAACHLHDLCALTRMDGFGESSAIWGFGDWLAIDATTGVGLVRTPCRHDKSHVSRKATASQTEGQMVAVDIDMVCPRWSLSEKRQPSEGHAS